MEGLGRVGSDGVVGMEEKGWKGGDWCGGPGGGGVWKEFGLIGWCWLK